jgi:O-acetyl-ADP-ribose deacetylase
MPTLGKMAIDVVTGDITALEVDVIVNAANETLAHGGGVAAAIARAGAPVVDEESAAWVSEHGPIGPGDAAHTRAGSMPARWVVHVVGPRYRRDQDNEGLLRQAVRAALDRAVELDARSVALPAISAGIFGYPRGEATLVIATEVETWQTEKPQRLDRVILVGFDDATADDFRRAIGN